MAAGRISLALGHILYCRKLPERNGNGLETNEKVSGSSTR